MQPLFQAQGVYKAFDSTQALKNASLTIYPGEVHGLVGENGSGKSTLASIISAVRPSDAGKMELFGEPYTPGNVPEAMEAGVSLIIQEEGSFTYVDVAANIFAGREKLFAKGGIVNSKAMHRAARKALDDCNIHNISEYMPMIALSFEQMKLVEVARAMSSDPKLLIVDETSAALSKDGRAILYANMQRMKDAQKAVLFIAHDIDELMAYSDRITILRDGENVITLTKDEFDADLIKSSMIGRPIQSDLYRAEYSASHGEKVAISTDKLCYRNIRDIDFSAYEGEIVGVGGLSGCGMHEFGQLLYGALRPDSGQIEVGDEKPKTLVQFIEAGVGYISKERDTQSLIRTMNIRDNICIVSLSKIAKGGLITKRQENSFMERWRRNLDIRMRDGNQFVMQLSGGNKQKVALAKWMGADPDIYIMDCPTRGIDVGVKLKVYQIIEELKKQGKTIILISEELVELIGMCDRIYIMKDGEVSGTFTRSDDLKERTLLDCMI